MSSNLAKIVYQPSLLSRGYWELFLWGEAMNMKLATIAHLVLTLSMCGALSSLPYISSSSTVLGLICKIRYTWNMKKIMLFSLKAISLDCSMLFYIFEKVVQVIRELLQRRQHGIGGGTSEIITAYSSKIMKQETREIYIQIFMNSCRRGWWWLSARQLFHTDKTEKRSWLKLFYLTTVLFYDVNNFEYICNFWEILWF